jgi:hypothetical protein
LASVTLALRRVVIERARGRCEYCGLAQISQEATFHIDHIKPRAAGGLTVLENLALACVSCSLFKEAKRSAADPQTGRSTPLFHPRRQSWSDHFRWDDVELIGTSATGRATVVALRMNRPIILEIRREEREHGRHPPE